MLPLTQTIGDTGNVAAPFTQGVINKPLLIVLFIVGAIIVIASMIAVSKSLNKKPDASYTIWEFIPVGMVVYVSVFALLLLAANLNTRPVIDTQPVHEQLARYGITVDDNVLRNAIRDSTFQASTTHVARGGAVESLTISSAKTENEDGSGGEYVVTWEVK